MSENAISGPMDAVDRRVLGVLVEKAKTTPAAYPLSLNALVSGSNQKSNRYPQMDLDEDRIEQAIDSLRQRGAVSIVQGDSRVERYRHLAYEWLGVDKVELAVMAELLLRGAQTVGELRGRAARMEPIKGIAELTPVLESLVSKGLIEYLSPPGRGAIVSHKFYTPGQLERVRRDFGLGQGSSEAPKAEAPSAKPAPSAVAASVPVPQSISAPEEKTSDFRAEIAALREEMQTAVSDLREELEAFKQRVEG